MTVEETGKTVILFYFSQKMARNASARGERTGYELAAAAVLWLCGVWGCCACWVDAALPCYIPHHLMPPKIMLQNSTSKQERTLDSYFPKRSKKHHGIISIPVKYHAKWGLIAAWLAIVQYNH